MEEKHLRRLRIRRGTDSQRKNVIFEEGEPVFTLDTERVYVGDDKTYGGILVSNKNFITDSIDRPIQSQPFDLFYDKTDKVAFLIDKNLDKIQITNSSIKFEKNQKDIDYIDALLKRLSAECCNPDNFLATDLDSDSFSDNILTDYDDPIRIK